MSDRTFFGAAFVVIGVGNLTVAHGYVELALVLVVVLGAVLMCSGIRRAISKTDPESGRRRPSRPW